MKKTFVAVLASGILLLTTPLGAEIYKYIDENGQQRWTDDLSQVPVAQRESAQRMESVEEPETESTPGTSPAADQTPPVADEPADGAAISRESLEREKADLDGQYQQLLEERKTLETLKEEAASATDREELNERIAAYNAKTEQYETQLNAFNDKVTAYNQQISKQGATPSE